MTILTDTARAAATRARWAAERAAELDTAREAARREAAETEREAADAARAEEAHRRTLTAQTVAALPVLRARLDAAVRAAADDVGRPVVETRVAARGFLWGGSANLVEVDDGPLHLIHEVQMIVGRLEAPDEETADAVDALETAGWRALLDRLRWLAGETP